MREPGYLVPRAAARAVPAWRPLGAARRPGTAVAAMPGMAALRVLLYFVLLSGLALRERLARARAVRRR